VLREWHWYRDGRRWRKSISFSYGMDLRMMIFAGKDLGGPDTLVVIMRYALLRCSLAPRLL
jgi:hypothetical protein